MAEDQPSRLFWEETRDFIGPLDDDHGILFAQVVGDAEARELRVGFQAIRVEMHQLMNAGMRRGMHVHERICRTRDFLCNTQMLGKPLHKGSLARTKRSFERKRLAAAQFPCQTLGKGVEFGERGNIYDVSHT